MSGKAEFPSALLSSSPVLFPLPAVYRWAGRGAARLAHLAENTAANRAYGPAAAPYALLCTCTCQYTHDIRMYICSCACPRPAVHAHAHARARCAAHMHALPCAVMCFPALLCYNAQCRDALPCDAQCYEYCACRSPCMRAQLLLKCPSSAVAIVAFPFLSGSLLMSFRASGQAPGNNRSYISKS